MQTNERILVEAPGAQAIFEKWIARGDAVGAFQNMALDSYSVGHWVFMPITPEQQAEVVVGKTAAPDGSYGMGWKYLLQKVSTDIADFNFVEEA